MVRERVWVAERPFIWNRIDVGGRMTILQLEDGSLLVSSPVRLDAELTAALKNLGPVAHIVVRPWYHARRSPLRVRPQCAITTSRWRCFSLQDAHEYQTHRVAALVPGRGYARI